MSYLVSHAAVRIQPPTGAERWRVTNLSTKKTYSFSTTAIMVLIAFIGGSEVRTAVDLLTDRCSLGKKVIEDAIDLLVSLGLLTTVTDASNQEVLKLCTEWAKFGWVDTADYQLATLDYPFADYAKDGREIDFERMKEYIKLEPDIGRTKKYKEAASRTSLPSTPTALKELSGSFASVWQGEPSLNVLTADRCKILLSSVFGILRRRPLSDSPDVIASAIGKTSPSGGARHPTECYLFVCNIEGLSPGVYHFNMNDETIDRIADFDTSSTALMSMFSGPMRASFDIDGFIVMTSVFDRNMWRYREPRSFRAIYMDVGHLCGTLDLVAKSLGINCLVQHGLSEEPIANILGTHPLYEGVIYGAAIGGSRRAAK